jgi:hypothetical protein
MLGFFTTKGLLLKKFKSYGSIIGLFGHIIKQRKIIHSKRKISDIEIMRSFCGTIKIPSEANDSRLNNKFEKLLSTLCKFSGYDEIVREP